MWDKSDIEKVKNAADIICDYCGSDWCDNCDVIRVIETVKETAEIEEV